MEGGRGEKLEEVGSSAIGGPVNHSLLSRYVTNSTSAISVTWPDEISLSRAFDRVVVPGRSGSFDLFFWRRVNVLSSFQMKFNISFFFFYVQVCSLDLFIS